jgi:hypothetical protein
MQIGRHRSILTRPFIKVVFGFHLPLVARKGIPGDLRGMLLLTSINKSTVVSQRVRRRVAGQQYAQNAAVI